MSYSEFAYVYDALMIDAPYDEWLALVREECHEKNLRDQHILDIACGTGVFAERLIREGFNVTGVDQSEEMLTVAKRRLPQSLFICQDMRALDVGQAYDGITILCDSLNYLLSIEEWEQTLVAAFNHLKPEGWLIFDVHATQKIESFIHDGTYALAEDDISYIWHSFEGSEPLSVSHELSIFVQDEQDECKYHRFDEVHEQRTFEYAEIEGVVYSSGFKITKRLTDFEANKSIDEGERWIFCCQKR
ncbi:class I SAM-dependent methyltransferase [Bacillaceae bacterium SIJ1]|uniref:class I SAM-dependent DNA methyltransferase n=1 Tax=Litoribacterium kuwaitense TaxID=1398745 RepID=UPI0013ED04C2|nr:class I SAM-dependent methyltransferase [Litoribacterium kuwaitense]NGP43489.1 class I SAM-dependent methyltransferase [Litoribacterium kuwaitense]